MMNYRNSFFEQARLIHRHESQLQSLQQIEETRELAMQLDARPSHTRRTSSLLMKSPASTIYDIPNQNFVGRDSILDEIHNYLNPSSLPSSGTTSCVVVHGMAGIGKTTVARRYAQVWATEYDAVFWLRAESKVELAETFADIADKLQLSPRMGPLAVETVRKWLEKTERRWLLIFDNVEALTDISAYWPSKTMCNGSILITTQRPGFPSLTHVHEIGLESLTQDEGCTLLSEMLIQQRPEQELLKQIVDDVGALPLALVIVGGYIRQSGSTLDEFTASLHHSTRVWNASAELTGSPYDKSLINVCRLALTELSQDAQDFIFLLAFLNPDEIPEQLLQSTYQPNSWWKANEQSLSYLFLFFTVLFAISTTLRYTLWMGPKNLWMFTTIATTLGIGLFSTKYKFGHTEDRSVLLRIFEPGSFMDITHELRQRQLISRGTALNESRFLTMHRVLQWSILHILDDDRAKRKVLFEQAFHLLRANLPVSDMVLRTIDAADRSHFEMVAPQVISLDKHASSLKPPLNHTVDFAFLLCDLGTFMWLEGLDREYIGVMQSAETIFNKAKYDEHAPIRSKLNVHLGRASEMAGVDGFEIGLSRKRQAVETCERNLSRKWVVKRDDTLVVWSARTDLAVALINNEMYEEAGQVMELGRVEYGKWRPETDEPFEHAQWYNHNAWVRMWQGKPREALLMQRHGIELQIAGCGRDSGLVYFKRFFLGCLLWTIGETDEAVTELKAVLDDRTRTLGESAFHSLQSLAFYGAVLYSVGRYKEAEEHLRRCLTLGAKHNWYPAHIARTQFYWSRTLRELARISESIEPERQCFEFRDKMLQRYPHLLKDDPTDEGSVFEQMVPTMTGKITSKLTLRKSEFMRQGLWDADSCATLDELGPSRSLIHR